MACIGGGVSLMLSAALQEWQSGVDFLLSLRYALYYKNISLCLNAQKKYTDPFLILILCHSFKSEPGCRDGLQKPAIRKDVIWRIYHDVS